MAGSSTIGKGDTSRSGLRGDIKGGGYRTTQKTQSAPGKGANLAGSTSIAAAPKTAPNKVNTLFAENRGKQPAWGSMSLTSRMRKHQTLPYTPGDYAAYRKTLPGFVAAAKGKKPVAPVAVAVKPPAKKPVVVKPVAKKLAPSVLRSALGMAPTKKATPSTKPPATRFGVVTGTKTGTRVSGGGGYGGGGTRGSGSLSGQGSGSRSMGTSRTGGTRGNNPVRG